MMSGLRIFVLIFLGYSQIDITAAFGEWLQPRIASSNGTGKASIMVPEDHAVNTSTGIILNVTEGIGNVTYFIHNSKYFSVEPNTGDVILRLHLDYESQKEINVSIGASDETLPFHRTCYSTMTVLIKDVNDNIPQFISSYSVHIDESAMIGTEVITISVVDVDSFSDIIYNITGGNRSGDFNVNSRTGVIVVARQLMTFRQSVYALEVIAVDSWGPKSKSFTATSTVSVMVDRNMRMPNRCDPFNITVNVSTHMKVGESVCWKMHCSNWLEDEPWVELTGPETTFFNLKNMYSTFCIQAKAPNPNSTWQVDLLIYAQTMRSRLLNTIGLTIRAIEINDPPEINPGLLEVNITENLPVGTVIGSFMVTDPDVGEWGELRIYSFDKPEYITLGPIVANKLDVIISGAVDIEIYKQSDDQRNPREWDTVQAIMDAGVGDERLHYDNVWDNDEVIVEFQVMVSDKQNLTSSAMVSLHIADANEFAPSCNPQIIIKKIPRDYYIERAIVAQWNICRDADFSTSIYDLSFNLLNDSCSAFSVRSSSGTMVLGLQEWKYLNQSSCDLLVTVRDNGNPELSRELTVNIKFLECPNGTDYRGTLWSRGVPGEYTWKFCDKNSTGVARRYCDENGNYHQPVYNCTRRYLYDIYNMLNKSTTTTERILKDLVNFTTSNTNTTENSLMIGDIEQINRILSLATKKVNPNSSHIQNITESFVDVANDIIDDAMTTTWKVMINETGSGADTVIDKLEAFVEKIVTAPNSNMPSTVYAKTNLMLKIGKKSLCERGINFPDRLLDGVPDWAANTSDRVNMPCLGDKSWDSYSCAMFRNLTKIMPSRSSNNTSQTSINAPVMSFTYYPKVVGKLQNPIEITFQLFDTELDSPLCSFWTRNISSNGSWSVSGCWLDTFDRTKNIVTCKCDHLTNFAVLMSPSLDAHSKESGHHLALSIISMVGCIISMICLILTVAIHVILWKTIKSVRTIIHINLASALFIAYLVFLAGIDKTENKGSCTAVAIILHLVYLIVFFVMFTEGLNLGYTVLKPLSTRKPGIPLLIASYVISIVIVGISMAAVQLEGYGNDSFCWLSTSTGLIWAFLAPVLIIALVNGVIVCLVIRKMLGTVAMSKKTNKDKARAAVRSILVLMPIMGLTWLFGIFSVNKDTVVFQYLFAIFNSIQGLLIFIFHCIMNKKIMTGLKKMIGQSRYKSTITSSSAETQKMTSKSQSTQDTAM